MKRLISIITISAIVSSCFIHAHSPCNSKCKQLATAVTPYLDSLYLENVKSKTWRIIGFSEDEFEHTYMVRTKLKSRGNFFGIDIKVDTQGNIIAYQTMLSDFN